MISRLRLFASAPTAAGLFLLALPVAAQDNPPDTFSLLEPVHALVEAFNRQDAKLPATVFADACGILDTSPPFRWSGPGAAQAWYSHLVGATAADKAQFQAARKHLMLGDPRYVQTEGTHAYFVLEGTLTFNDGQLDRRTIGQWTVTETKTATGWRIDGLAWGVLRED